MAELLIIIFWSDSHTEVLRFKDEKALIDYRPLYLTLERLKQVPKARLMLARVETTKQADIRYILENALVKQQEHKTDEKIKEVAQTEANSA